MPEIVLLLETSPLFFTLIATLLGMTVGSFLNVVVHRLPIMMEREWKQEYQAYFAADVDGEIDQESSDTATPPEIYNLVKPDSTCPHCGHKIRAWENIPVVSYLLLRGKCSQCQTPISMRYPAVELLTGLLSALVAWHFGFGTEAAAALVFTWTLIALTFIDLDKMLLPDQMTLPLLWGGLMLSLGTVFSNTTDAIIGAAAGYLSLWSLYWSFKLLTGKEGMGYGDFKLLAAIGAWLGWQLLPVVILLSSFVGAIIGIAVLTLQGKEKSQPIPFGPYLAVAGWIAMLYGDALTQAYWQFVLQ